MEEISELIFKIDIMIIGNKFRDRIKEFFDNIRKNIDRELIDNNRMYELGPDYVSFFLNVKYDNKLYEKLINYLDSENIKYGIYIDDHHFTVVVIKFKQFYEKVYTECMETIFNNINNLLDDIRNNVDNRIIDNKKYIVHDTYYTVIFSFNMKEDKDLCEKLKNYLDYKRIKYIEDEFQTSLNKFKHIEILPTEFIYYLGLNMNQNILNKIITGGVNEN
jgi:hypothetical protein